MPWLARIAFICLMFQTLPAWAGNIALVLSERGGMYGEFANTLDESLAGTNWSVSARLDADTAAQAAGSADLIVTVGSEALRQTLSRGEHLPIVATLLPRQNYEKLLAEFHRTPPHITAIYLDQPAARQAAFVRQLLPGLKRAGMLLSNDTRPSIGQYRQAFAGAGLTLDSEDADSDKALLPALNALLGRVNVLIAIPDSSIYQRANIKAILITAFRYQRPVIGYSVAFVNAGALAALHTTPAQAARQTAELILSHGTTLTPPSGPSQFAIAINHNVAQALDLNIPDEAAIRRAMLADREAR